MRFSYYERLTRKERAIYRKSDAIAEVRLPERAPLQRAAAALREALSSRDRVAVELAAQGLVSRLLRQLEVPPVTVRVLACRPRSATSELHGLYSYEEGKRPLIQVWMRTAAERRVVRFRTFLRTLLHEVGHHLDYTLFELEDSFHTRGFFQRESSLVRQLAPKTDVSRPERRPAEPRQAKARLSQKGGDPQLPLFPC